jgi:hypothetical protein
VRGAIVLSEAERITTMLDALRMSFETTAPAEKLGPIEQQFEMAKAKSGYRGRRDKKLRVDQRFWAPGRRRRGRQRLDPRDWRDAFRCSTGPPVVKA